MHPAAQYLIPLLYAAGFSAIGWLMAYLPEPAPGLYWVFRGRQRNHFVKSCRLGGRLFGVAFAAWTVVYFVLTIVDLLR